MIGTMTDSDRLPRQEISFVSSVDGTRIAVAAMGEGPVILRAAHWLSHVSKDIESPVWRPWLSRLSARNRMIRYDLRGCGLSDRDVDEIGFDAWQADLEAVASTISEPFVLMGMSQGAALAIAYALRHPDRVSSLILIGGYARGLLARGTDDATRMEAETLSNLMLLGWGKQGSAFSHVFTQLFVPNGTAQQVGWWEDLQRLSASPDVAARTLDVLHRIDVIEEARRLALPVLVMHSRHDARIPFEQGRQLAAAIPGASFVALESANHVLLEQEPAWDQMWREIDAFLGNGAPRPDIASRPAQAISDLSPAERDVLGCLTEGLGNSEIAARLGKSEKTVRNQVSTILGKLGARSRSEAIVQVLSGRQRDI
ncbi:pimeloyl-ACP methyl ester carboxylesterase/DNA-binding CsgD family transcriptional regulator [Rhodovulum iodosum]|uniref:Pimeloyl-ACP methyl ester carboxylesterase/DNA-binding CsgD family transcriptional regulator n=2 Tax=Rhodovulum iodosum TaxID=68291 RepID=A0ABV3XQB6_9RHOB